MLYIVCVLFKSICAYGDLRQWQYLVSIAGQHGVHAVNPLLDIYMGTVAYSVEYLQGTLVGCCLCRRDGIKNGILRTFQ